MAQENESTPKLQSINCADVSPAEPERHTQPASHGTRLTETIACIRRALSLQTSRASQKGQAILTYTSTHHSDLLKEVLMCHNSKGPRSQGKQAGRKLEFTSTQELLK